MLHTVIRSFFIPLLVLVVPGVASAQASDPSISGPLEKLSGGVQAGDAALIASAYAEDAVLLPPGGDVVKGRAAIEAFWAKRFQTGMNPLDGGTSGMATSGDLGYEWGVATFEARVNDTLVTDPVKYLNVLKKDASAGWQIVATIWNSSRTP